VKTIYTDKYGFLPWMMLAASGSMLWVAYKGSTDGDRIKLGLTIGAGIAFLFLALNRLWAIREAKREGRDYTIIRTKDATNP
jgi:hypothetical protein